MAEQEPHQQLAAHPLLMPAVEAAVEIAALAPAVLAVLVAGEPAEEPERLLLQTPAVAVGAVDFLLK